MQVLFDQAIPAPIRSFLKGHDVKTAAKQSWATLRNGELLKLAEEAGIEVLLTTDKNIRYQQNLEGRNMTIVVIGHPQWPELHPHVQLVVKAVNAATPGS